MKRSRLGTLGAVLGTALATIADAGAIERAAHRVVAHAWQVLRATAADHHHRVLLEVVPLAADVAGDLEAVGQAHAGDLAKGRVRLLRRGGVNARTHAAPLRAGLQRGHRRLLLLDAAGLADELVDRCHILFFPGFT